MAKTCKKCDEIKDLSEFTSHPTTKDLKHAWCRPCLSKYHKERRERIKKEGNGKVRKGKKKNRRTKAFAKSIRNKWVHIHRARRENPGAPIDTDITLRKLYYRDKRTCQICHEDVTWGDASIDHIIPYEKGGTHTWDNVQLAHLNCNLKKGTK